MVNEYRDGKKVDVGLLFMVENVILGKLLCLAEICVV